MANRLYNIPMSNLTMRLFRQLPMGRSTRAYAFALELLRLPQAERLLDVGSGQGHGATFLSRALPQAQVFGLDRTLECRPEDRPAHAARPPLFVQASAPFFPFAADSMDAIFLVMTFHCLPQPQRVVAEAARILRPGGALIIADVNGEHWMARPFEWFEHRFISPLTHAWSAGELRTLAAQAGLEDVTIHHRPGKENGFMQWIIARK